MLSGESTGELVCLDDFEVRAKQILDEPTFQYFASGANDEQTLHENRRAFRRIKLRPRMLRGVTFADMRTSLLGHPISMPICVAPTACHKLAHNDGELATARAASAASTCMANSLSSTVAMETLQEAAPTLLRWNQIKCFYDEKRTIRLIRRIERSGAKALFFNVDAPVLGKRPHNLRDNFKIPFRLPNLEDRESDASDPKPGAEPMHVVLKRLTNPYFGKPVVEWLRTQTRLPIILKGIVTPEDAEEAVEWGVDAIVVSNHGGRQLDCVPSSIDVLPEIVKAVRGRVEIYMDGGVRTGTDVLKALALGARAVFIGRPVLWGLACQGEKGVTKVLEMLREELRLAMILSGCASFSDVNESLVWSPQAAML